MSGTDTFAPSGSPHVYGAASHAYWRRLAEKARARQAEAGEDEDTAEPTWTAITAGTWLAGQPYRWENPLARRGVLGGSASWDGRPRKRHKPRVAGTATKGGHPVSEVAADSPSRPPVPA